MPTGMRIVGMPKELLPMACWRKEKDQILANSGLIVKKKSGL